MVYEFFQSTRLIRRVFLTSSVWTGGPPWDSPLPLPLPITAYAHTHTPILTYAFQASQLSNYQAIHVMGWGGTFITV